MHYKQIQTIERKVFGVKIKPTMQKEYEIQTHMYINLIDSCPDKPR